MQITHIRNAFPRNAAFGERARTAKRGIISQLIIISVCNASPADMLTAQRTCKWKGSERTESHENSATFLRSPQEPQSYHQRSKTIPQVDGTLLHTVL